MNPGDTAIVEIEKAVAGGRMLARSGGRVVLVRGAIPGERARIRIERVSHGVAYGAVDEILEASPDRRDPERDWACGGAYYAHIEYPRQLALKADILLDAFARIGRMPLPAPPAMTPSPETGYRMKARLHVRGRRLGFFREGTHDLCPVAESGQLAAGASAAVAALEAALVQAPDLRVDAVHLAENIIGDERAVHLETAPGAALAQLSEVTDLLRDAGFTGATGWAAKTGGPDTIFGSPYVHDVLALLPPGDARDVSVRLQRRPEAFFQANRFLVESLVQTVVDAAGTAPAIDLYAGVGLFATALAAAGSPEVVAVEGAPQNLSDLRDNARPYGDVIKVVHQPVEEYFERGLAARRASLILDPPRTGLSKQTVRGLTRSDAHRMVYVSCDPATLARDVRLLVDAGFEVRDLRGFDLFPSTAHVEVVATLERAS